MATYIVKEKNELHIYREDQKEAFLADYGPMMEIPIHVDHSFR
jgi:hypothetical protein